MGVMLHFELCATASDVDRPGPATYAPVMRGAELIEEAWSSVL